MGLKWHRFYSDEAGAYDATRYGSWYGRLFADLHRQVLAEALGHVVPGGAALEVASGTGHALSVIADHSERVVATDATMAMLAVAKEKQRGDDKVTFVVNDAFQLPFLDESFDFVVATRFLHLFDHADQRRILREMSRVLRPEGLMIVDFYSRWHWMMLLPFIATYRSLRGRRATGDTRSSVRQAKNALMASGLIAEGVRGLGGYYLAPLQLLPEALANSVARQLVGHLLPGDACEQFLIFARKGG